MTLRASRSGLPLDQSGDGQHRRPGHRAAVFAFDGYAWNGDYDFSRSTRFHRGEGADRGRKPHATFGLVKPEDATLSFDYFRTQFYNQVVADQEYSATEVMFYNTDGRSYTDTYQVDFNWTPVERLDIFATYRYTDSSMTLDRPDGGRVQVERPLVSRYKALLNIQYATRFRRWTFDATAQLNGPMRLPSQTGDRP